MKSVFSDAFRYDQNADWRQWNLSPPAKKAVDVDWTSGLERTEVAGQRDSGSVEGDRPLEGQEGRGIDGKRAFSAPTLSDRQGRAKSTAAAETSTKEQTFPTTPKGGRERGFTGGVCTMDI